MKKLISFVFVIAVILYFLGTSAYAALVVGVEYKFNVYTTERDWEGTYFCFIPGETEPGMADLLFLSNPGDTNMLVGTYVWEWAGDNGEKYVFEDPETGEIYRIWDRVSHNQYGFADIWSVIDPEEEEPMPWQYDWCQADIGFPPGDIAYGYLSLGGEPEAVPEPAAMTIFGLNLLGLAIKRFRK